MTQWINGKKQVGEFELKVSERIFSQEWAWFIDIYGRGIDCGSAPTEALAMKAAEDKLQEIRDSIPVENKTAIELAEDLAQRLLVNGLLNEKHIETDFALVIKYITQVLAPHIATESKIKADAPEYIMKPCPICNKRTLARIETINKKTVPEGTTYCVACKAVITRHLSAGGE